MSRFQGTVARTIKFAGVGLHTGKMVNLEIIPGAPNSGIYFQRSDIDGSKPILAHPKNISSTILCTAVGFGSHRISTIEHLMAAFMGLGIDNALVKIDATEVPILDGSSAPFVDRINEIGVQLQHAKRKILSLSTPVEIVDGDRFVKYYPHELGAQDNEDLEIECSIDFASSKAIGEQKILYIMNKENFMKIYDARTFCHINDVEEMREKGLALGGSLDNAVVVNSKGVMNIEGLRYPNEFVKHKLLDFVGDTALLGGHLSGQIKLQKAGHALHAEFVRAIINKLQDQVQDIPTKHTSSIAKVVNQG